VISFPYTNPKIFPASFAVQEDVAEVSPSDIPWFAELSPPLQNLYKLTRGESG
jgi:hypothetical protein